MNSLFASNPSAECRNRAECEADFDSGAPLRLPSHSIRQPCATIVFLFLSELICIIFPGTSHVWESLAALYIGATKANQMHMNRGACGFPRISTEARGAGRVAPPCALVPFLFSRKGIGMSRIRTCLRSTYKPIGRRDAG